MRGAGKVATINQSEDVFGVAVAPRFDERARCRQMDYEDAAKKLSNSRNSDLDSRIHSSKNNRQISSNKKLDLSSRRANARNHLVEVRCKHLRCAVVLRDIFYTFR